MRSSVYRMHVMTRSAMAQGALDGGLDIPHSEKRFVGYSADDKSLDAEVLRKHIYGGHVAEYMEEMQEEAPEKYQVLGTELCMKDSQIWT